MDFAVFHAYGKTDMTGFILAKGAAVRGTFNAVVHGVPHQLRENLFNEPPGAVFYGLAINGISGKFHFFVQVPGRLAACPDKGLDQHILILVSGFADFE
jgi:hypothetical protein